MENNSNAPVARPEDLDYDWVGALSGRSGDRDEAIGRLREMMLRVSRFRLGQMGETARLGSQRADEIANDAVVAILDKLDTFEGRSRFTTWAYKFAILHATSTLRREVWRHREVDLDAVPEPTDSVDQPADRAEHAALRTAVRDGIERALTPHQKRVFLALTFQELPIDVVAERFGSTRNAIYKTLHDARKRLKADLNSQGFLEAAMAGR